MEEDSSVRDQDENSDDIIHQSMTGERTPEDSESRNEQAIQELDRKNAELGGVVCCEIDPDTRIITGGSIVQFRPSLPDGYRDARKEPRGVFLTGLNRNIGPFIFWREHSPDLFDEVDKIRKNPEQTWDGKSNALEAAVKPLDDEYSLSAWKGSYENAIKYGIAHKRSAELARKADEALESKQSEIFDMLKRPIEDFDKGTPGVPVSRTPDQDPNSVDTLS